MTRILWFLAVITFIAALILFNAARGAMHEMTAAVVAVGAIVATVGAIINGTLQKILVASRGEYRPPTPEEIAEERKFALLLVVAVVALIAVYVAL